MENKVLEQTLREGIGFFGEKDLAAMIAEFGTNFPVVTMDYTRNRKWITLGELQADSKEIRNVFLSSEQYDKLFGKPVITLSGLLENEGRENK